VQVASALLVHKNINLERLRAGGKKTLGKGQNGVGAAVMQEKERKERMKR